MNAIIEFIKDKFPVDGKYFSNLEPKDKETFLKYQIPIIDLDIHNEDPEIIEIFKRLNRTFYSLSAIEKLSTEFAPSEFMLLAKLLIDELKFNGEDGDEYGSDLPLQFDPTTPTSFIDWAATKKIKYYNKLIIEEGIFTTYELTRQVHLMYTLNIISVYKQDFFNRNETTNRLLEEYAEMFPDKDIVLNIVERAANKFLRLKLKKKSYWLNKANSFSILCLFLKNINEIEAIEDKVIKDRLDQFESNLPGEYQLAAKEAVNNKRERLIRNQYLENIILKHEMSYSIGA
jgi:broad-specificity NMP kinase